jgi:hypothetical protein
VNTLPPLPAGSNTIGAVTIAGTLAAPSRKVRARPEMPGGCRDPAARGRRPVAC